MTAVRRPARLEGVLELPGDKSVSHRALILNSIATGEAQVENLSPGADVVSTADCLRALGVEIEAGRVAGRGFYGLRPAAGPLDCGLPPYQVTFDATSEQVLEVAEEPAGASLSNPWPNPARNSLSVRLALPRAGRVEVDALDLAGRRVRSIVAGELTGSKT